MTHAAPASAALALLLAAAAPVQGDHGIGTDLATFNFCLYGDCEARGTYAADPYNLYNPGTLAVATHMYFKRGVVPSGSYYHLDLGPVDGDIGAGAVTFAYAPVALQVATLYAEAEGPVRALPGVDMSFRTRAVRLAAAVDAERTFGIEGLALGLAGVVPGTTSDLRLSTGGRTFVRSTETRQLELIPGAHLHRGERDWFMVGGFLDVTRNDVESQGLDPVSGTPLRRSGTLNTWFARVGLSLLAFVPLGLADGDSLRAEWLSAFRLGIDVEYRSISVPSETGKSGAAGFFGADAPLLPDRLNPLASWLRIIALGGVDTRGGWGIGAGLQGQGPLRFLTCNPAYSDRPLTEFLGDRVTALVATCSVIVPM